MKPMKTWNNGEKGGGVKKIIDENFQELDRRTKQTVEIYVKTFTVSDWFSGTIFIQNSEYNKSNPCIELYIKDGTGYSVVFGGYKINEYGIELYSDIAYEGKVVIR